MAVRFHRPVNIFPRVNGIVTRDMTMHTLTITLGDAADLRWAQHTVTAAHYLHAPVYPRARPMCLF